MRKPSWVLVVLASWTVAWLFAAYGAVTQDTTGQTVCQTGNDAYRAGCENPLVWPVVVVGVLGSVVLGWSWLRARARRRREALEHAGCRRYGNGMTAYRYWDRVRVDLGDVQFDAVVVSVLPMQGENEQGYLVVSDGVEYAVNESEMSSSKRPAPVTYSGSMDNAG